MRTALRPLYSAATALTLTGTRAVASANGNVCAFDVGRPNQVMRIASKAGLPAGCLIRNMNPRPPSQIFWDGPRVGLWLPQDKPPGSARTTLVHLYAILKCDQI